MAGGRPAAPGRASRGRTGASAGAARPSSRGSRPRCCRSGWRSRRRPTMPTVCAIATRPPIRPRRSTGTWSGIAAITAAYIALRNTWTPHQPSSITAPTSAAARTSSDSAPPAAPTRTHGSRRPQRQRRPVGERAEDRVADRRDGGADAEHEGEHRLLAVGRDRGGLLGEQHLDRSEPARHDAEVDQRQRRDPARRRVRVGSDSADRGAVVTLCGGTPHISDVTDGARGGRAGSVGRSSSGTSPYVGQVSTARSHHSSRSGPSGSSRTSYVALSAPSCRSTSGWARKLWAQTGSSSGPPPYDATAR